jgi:hypothetical protein
VDRAAIGEGRSPTDPGTAESERIVRADLATMTGGGAQSGGHDGRWVSLRASQLGCLGTGARHIMWTDDGDGDHD